MRDPAFIAHYGDQPAAFRRMQALSQQPHYATESR